MERHFENRKYGMGINDIYAKDSLVLNEIKSDTGIPLWSEEE